MAVKTITEKNQNSKNTSGKAKSAAKGIWGRFCFPVMIVLSLAFCVFAIWLICLIPCKLLYENPRFNLQRIEVKSPGFWHGKGDLLIARLGDDSVRTGINVFNLDAGDVRKKLLKVHNIEDAEVQIVLPDMIVFNIRERIPRAELGRNIVVDEYGKLFKRSESSASNRTLPRLIKKNPDKKLQIEAINLIMTATRECQNIVIESIKIDNPHYFEVILLTMLHDNRRWKVLFPIGSESYGSLFNKLQNAILHTYLNRDTPIGFDLRFKTYATPLYK